MAVKPKTYWALIRNDEVLPGYVNYTRKNLVSAINYGVYGDIETENPKALCQSLSNKFMTFRIAKVRFQEVES